MVGTLRRIVFSALVLIAAPFSAAHAGVWEWACQGQAGEQQIFFNRFSLYVVQSKKPLGKLVSGDGLGKSLPADKIEYETNNGNDGLIQTITAQRTGDDKVKLELTEKSSKRLTHKHRVICGRDEDTDTYRKVYSLKMGSEPARNIVMQCREYQLTTSGGKRCD